MAHVCTDATAALGDCQICGQPSHGVHFGVNACRACAAFFRRTVVLGNQYACRKQNLCSISIDERAMCRGCRFDKCLREGMKTDNVQYNRDRLSSTQSRGGEPLRRKRGREGSGESAQPATSPQPSTSTVHPPSAPAATQFQKMHPSPSQPPLTCTSQTQSTIRFAPASSSPFSAPMLAARSSLIGMAPDVIEQIDEVFEKFTPTFDLPIQPTLLQRMTIGYNKHVKARIDDVKVHTVCDAAFFTPLWKRYMVDMAKWAMHCPAFVQLEKKDKFALFSSRMAAFIRLEKTWISLKLYEVQKQKMADFAVFVVSDNIAVDMHNVKMDISGFTDASAEQIKTMFSPLYTQMLSRVARPIIDNELSEFEIIYMLCALFWSVEEVPDISAAAQEKADMLRDSIANELHDYFLYQLDTSNYAHRMMLIMRIINSIDDVIQERMGIFEMAHLFGVIKPDGSDKLLY